MRTRPVVMLLGTMALLAWASSAPAQEADSRTAEEGAQGVPEIADLSPEELGERGAAMLENLRKSIAESRYYHDSVATATVEDSLVLWLQLVETEDRIMADLRKLHELATTPGDHKDKLRSRVEGLYLEVTPRLWGTLRELDARIDRLRAMRTETAPAELSDLEGRIRLISKRLDEFLLFGLDHLRNLEELGLPVEADRDTFKVILRERADGLSGRMALAKLRTREFGRRLKETPGDPDLTARLLAARKSFVNNTESLQVAVELMDGVGLDSSRYRGQLVAATQDLASGLLDVKVAVNLLQKAWVGIRTWFKDRGPTLLVKLLLFAAIMFAGRLMARLVSKAVEKSLNRTRVNMSALLKRMTVTATRNTIVVVALVFGLAQLGISLGPMLAGFGVVGFILGFAMQDSLGNLAAGMMILINRPYDVGDVVEISGVFGKVENMSMVSTSVLTLDNQKLVVPNSKIWGDVIKNVTDQRIRRVDMVFGISYTDDIPHAERVLNQILADHEKVLDDPEPMVRLHTLGDSSVDFVVRPWVPTSEYWNVYWDVTRAVKMRFDEEGISIPFPQRDVHLYERKKLPRARSVLQDVEQDPVDASGTTAPDPVED